MSAGVTGPVCMNTGWDEGIVLIYVHACAWMEGTYPVLGQVDSRKAALADLLPTSELANNLIWLLFKVRRWRWATAYSSRRRSRCRHDCCDPDVTASFDASSPLSRWRTPNWRVDYLILHGFGQLDARIDRGIRSIVSCRKRVVSRWLVVVLDPEWLA
jgi:hypothetical protein